MEVQLRNAKCGGFSCRFFNVSTYMHSEEVDFSTSLFTIARVVRESEERERIGLPFFFFFFFFFLLFFLVFFSTSIDWGL